MLARPAKNSSATSKIATPASAAQGKSAPRAWPERTARGV